MKTRENYDEILKCFEKSKDGEIAAFADMCVGLDAVAGRPDVIRNYVEAFRGALAPPVAVNAADKSEACSRLNYDFSTFKAFQQCETQEQKDAFLLGLAKAAHVQAEFEMNYDALCLALAYKDLFINGVEEISEEEAHRLYEAGGHCNWPGGNEDKLLAVRDQVISDHKALSKARGGKL